MQDIKNLTYNDIKNVIELLEQPEWIVSRLMPDDSTILIIGNKRVVGKGFPKPNAEGNIKVITMPELPEPEIKPDPIVFGWGYINEPVDIKLFNNISI